MSPAILCGQLLVCGYAASRPSPAQARAIRAGERGGVILFKRNIIDVEDVAAHIGELAAAAPEPLLVAVDQEGGRVSRLGAPVLALPPALRISALPEEDIARVARLHARELRALGITMNLAPVLDVDTRQESPIIGNRSFGTTPEQATRGALAFLRGMKDGGLLACGKHFPGHGDTRTDSHLELPVVHADRARLDAVELAPFRAAIRAGVDALMTAHVVYPALSDRPATLSRAIATDLLREELGFAGVLVSDDLEMRAIAAHHTHGDAAALAIEAGCDLILVCASEDAQVEAHEALVRRAERDGAFRARCEEACSRVLRMKKACIPRPDLEHFRALVRSEEAREAARLLGGV
jgi:beta-N-acetylhexosaminidase